MRILICLIALLFTVTYNAPAQETITGVQTTAYRNAVVYSGPGETYVVAGILNPGIPIVVAERNRIGNWLHVIGTNGSGDVFIDGWVMSGYLNLPADLRYGELSVNSALPDADPSTVTSKSMSLLYNVPVIPYIGGGIQETFLRGQSLGNHSSVVTKVGDSVSANPMYLTLMSQNDYVLGPYDYLEETIAFFGHSLAVPSVASRIGMSTYVIFDPAWADENVCQPSETPLACEYRLKQPGVAFIMFGPNDVRHMTHEEFDVQMRKVVDETLTRGIIPVLSTFSVHPDDGLWGQALNFNLVLVDIANDYQIPLMNLWAAARALPNYGLEVDNIHLTNSGFRYLKYDTGHESWYGVSLQNLLSIRTLDELRRTLAMN